METINLKEEARSLIDKLPENFTWSDLISAIEKKRHIDRPQNFWEALQKFRQDNNLEEEGIEPEVFDGVRDK
ncbi:hypothetical protein QUB60_14770 [Microcoleus sp. A2-C5]|uniref:hypothetical protein n=1 Tax=unclassified Microcoleus TaxID=2642155 RepID=UPI002FD09494